MSLLSASLVAKSYGAQRCFHDVAFTLDAGDRVALIGANGTGKTSLFRILLGTLDHEGTVSRQKGLRIGILEQDPRLPEEATVHEAVIEAAADLARIEKEMAEIHRKLAEPGAETDALLARLSGLQTRFEHEDGYAVEGRAERILEGVGLPRSRHGDRVAGLSGGERNRVALARLLLVEADLWMLDEPTNHLDLAGIAFLEEFLVQSGRSVLVISHDRRFLDAVTTETWELEGERLWTYPAPYTRARLLREERLKSATRAYEKQRETIAAQEEYIRRYGAGQRARQARGRKTRLERVARLEDPEHAQRALALALPRGEPLGARPPLEARDLSLDYGKGPLFTGLSFSVEPGETLGIVGPNGAGKTSLLRILTGEQAPGSGSLAWSPKVQRGLLGQQEEFPDAGSTPFQYLRNHEPKRPNQALRNTLGAMLFHSEEADKPISALSGGERKRLMLTRLLLEGNNVLLLDEPTNHLDLPSREAVEFALSTFEGTLLVVSHDRYFLDQVADRVLWIEDGRWRITVGGYAEAQAARSEAPPPKPKAAPKTKPKAKKLTTTELEKRIIACEERLKELAASPSGKKRKACQAEAERVRRELEALEAEYAGR